MSLVDWTLPVQINVKVFRFCGLWPEKDVGYKFDFHAFRLFVIAIVFMSGHWITQGINIYFTRTNLEALIGTIYVFLLEGLLLMKVYSWTQTVKKLQRMLEILNTEKFQPRNDNQKKMIENNFWFYNFVYKVYGISLIPTHVFWFTYPLLDDLSSQLPFMAWFPYDVSKTPAYQLTYLFQVIAVIFISLLNFTIDTFVVAFIMYIGCQFDILCDNIKNLHKLGSNIKENIIFCIEQHKDILK